jgi:hypothetical protein
MRATLLYRMLNRAMQMFHRRFFVDQNCGAGIWSDLRRDARIWPSADSFTQQVYRDVLVRSSDLTPRNRPSKGSVDDK